MKTTIILYVIWIVSSVAQAASGITYHGRILRSNGTPITSSNTEFRIQIKSPGDEGCLFWEEFQTKDLSQMAGVFSVTIGDTDAPGRVHVNVTNPLTTNPFTLLQAFSNKNSFPSGLNCDDGSGTYYPATNQGRKLQVYFREGPTFSWETLPPASINFVPLAYNSTQLDGYRSNEFLKVESAAVYTPLTAGQVNTLMDVIAGTNTPLPDVGTAGTYGSASLIPVITTDTKGRITVVTNTAVNDSTKLSLSGGTLTGPINMGLQNITNATTLSANNFSGRNLILNDNDTNTVTVRSPTDITISYALTLPLTDGDPGQVLRTDGSGLLSWIAPSTGSLTGISSTNSYLTIDNTVAAVPTLTVNVGTAANTVAAGNDSRITGALQTTDYNADVAPAATCTTTQTPYWNTVSGAWACQNINFSTGGFVNGGNSFGAVATLGTNDDYTLNIETNNSNRITILNTGFVGVGTIAPRSLLHVSGADAMLTVQNTIDGQRGQFFGQSYNAANFGLYNDSGAAWGVVPDGAQRVFFAYGDDGQVGSTTNNFDSPIVYRNLLDDGSGNASFTGYVRATSFISTSDRRLKTDITKVSGLDIIRQINGVTWNWKSNGQSDAGIIAQEVEKVMPELIHTDPNTGFKAVRYQGLIAPLIESVKSLDLKCQMRSSQIEILERKLASVENENKELNNLILELTLRVQKIENQK